MKDFLKSEEPYIAHLACRESAGSDCENLRVKVLEDSRITGIIAELQDWPGPQISSHKSAKQFFHKLVFLSDIGIDVSFPGMAGVVEKILSGMDSRGIPQLSMTIAEAFGGTGESLSGWVLCDAPNTLYGLKKMGVTDERIGSGTDYLVSLAEPYGFGCKGSEVLGKWRGPGKASDPCPYATLIMLKLMCLFPGRYEKEKLTAAGALLDLWENSTTRHPYIFYMGTDFRKLKLPFIWYDILHCAAVLSQVEGIRADGRLRSMIEIIKAKRSGGGFIPESVYMPFKEWDFGQKKAPSVFMDYVIARILARMGRMGR